MSFDYRLNPGLPDQGSGGYRPGDLIAKHYRLIRLIGCGGMGAIWVAENTGLDAPVALKLLHSDGADTDDAVRRLRHEARAAARLGHPGIVRMLDFGVTETGDPFIAMELLHGETLAELLHREQRLPAIQSVALLLPVADALSAAHRKRIVHRDLKPENVLIAREADGRVQPKIVDFGIATFEREATRPGSVAEESGAGSIDYMSPEQIYDQYVDHRSDIWSFSVVLYQCTTGHLPFARDSSYDILRAITDDSPVPLHEHCAGDAGLWQLIERGLCKEPDARWPSMHELGRELARWLLERGVAEDVCGASLRTTWLGGSSLAAGGRHGPAESVRRPGRSSAAPRHDSTISTRPPPVQPGLARGDETSLPALVPRTGSPHRKARGLRWQTVVVGCSLSVLVLAAIALVGVGYRQPGAAGRAVATQVPLASWSLPAQAPRTAGSSRETSAPMAPSSLPSPPSAPSWAPVPVVHR